MLTPTLSSKFKNDYKRMEKRHKDMGKLDAIIDCIIWERPLPEHCRPHILSGRFAGLWECHIEGNWILTYDLNPIEKKVYFSRTGTHSDVLNR